MNDCHDLYRFSSGQIKDEVGTDRPKTDRRLKQVFSHVSQIGLFSKEAKGANK